MNISLPHLIRIEDLSQQELFALLDFANKLLQDYVRPQKCINLAEGKIVTNLFFEPSTRTCNSFEIAAQRLNALSITPHLQASSLLKGETVFDTVQTLEAMGTQVFVIRHEQHGIMQKIATHLNPGTHLINAGEGWLHHPTQALLDLLTISQHTEHWETLKIALVGDLFHSRVAHSLISAFNLVGIKELRLVAPEALQPEQPLGNQNTTYTTNLARGLEDADVVICLRLQKERMSIERAIPEKEFAEHYQISTQTLRYAKKNALVMHPGPINRGIEVSDEVADGKQAVILQQVQCGVALRMAILHLFLSQ